jgi:hypothetical protein
MSYATREAAPSWDEALEVLKDKLRLLAHRAIEIVAKLETKHPSQLMEHAVSLAAFLS